MVANCKEVRKCKQVSYTALHDVEKKEGVVEASLQKHSQGVNRELLSFRYRNACIS